MSKPHSFSGIRKNSDRYPGLRRGLSYLPFQGMLHRAGDELSLNQRLLFESIAALIRRIDKPNRLATDSME